MLYVYDSFFISILIIINRIISEADAGILKRQRGGAGDEGGHTMVGATCQKILKIRPPRLAKNALAQCYIKLSFIAEIS